MREFNKQLVRFCLFFLFSILIIQTKVFAETTQIYKLQPKYLTTNFNFDMISGTITKDEHNFYNTGNFRTNKDLCGMSWETEDYSSHPSLKYPTNGDFTGVSLKYNYSISGCTELMNSGNAPTLTIETNDGYAYYVRLWNYVVDRPVDDWESGVSSLVNANVRFPENRTPGGANGSTGAIQIDFDNLYAGWSPFYWDGSNWAANPYWIKVPVNNIRKIMWSFVPSNFNWQTDDKGYFSDSNQYRVDFKNWNVYGNTSLGNQPQDQQASDIRICDDYDDTYYLTPERIVDEYKKLGYRDTVNFYVGASHYYDKKYNGAQMEMKTASPFNVAFESWYSDYMSRLHSQGMNLINSVSMESVDAPSDWWQRTWDNKPASTLWTPTPHLLSFNNDKVKTFYKMYTQKLASMANQNGLVPIIQLGEPWWWYNETEESKPPCFYDEATRNLFLQEKGYPMYEFKSSTESIVGHEDMLNWLRDKNGQFTLMLRDSIKSQFPNAKFTVLFFTPSVIDIDRVPAMMSLVNFPKEQWKYPNLDFFMLEDYDYLIFNQWDKHFDNLDFVQENLGYSEDKIHYLAGFVPGGDYAYVWNNIDQAINDGYNKKFQNVYVWAASQIKAWGWQKPDVIKANIPSGIYNKQIEVTLSSGTSTDEIKYTLDGSDPSKNGVVYTTPIKIKNTSLLRAVISKGAKKGNIVSFSYGINYFSPDSHFGKDGTNPATGNFSKGFTDLSIESPGNDISFKRTYNSLDASRTGTLFGNGWTFNYESTIKDYNSSIIYADGSVGQVASSDVKEVRLPDGSVQHFILDKDLKYNAVDSRNELIQLPANTTINSKTVKYQLTTKDQNKYLFNSDGYLVLIKDRNDNTVVIDVDSSGKITKITDAVNRSFSITYENNLIKSITDLSGNRSINYVYDSGKLKQVIDAVGNKTNYIYDTKGFLCEIRNGRDEILDSVVYNHSDGDNKDKVDHTKNSFGNTLTYSYDNLNGKTTITDSKGRVETSWYDKSLSITNNMDADGKMSHITYNKSMNGMNEFWEEKSVTDRNGNTTTYDRDDRGNITKITNPDGSVKTKAYDDKNNVIEEKDESGKRTFYIYDANKNNILKKVQSLNGTDDYSDTVEQSKFAITQYIYFTDSEAQQLGYGGKALLKSVTNPEGNTTEYTYDSSGNIKSVSDPEKYITKFAYNSSGYKTSSVSAKNYTTSYIYDNNGNLEKTTLNGGEVTRIAYDDLGRKLQEVSANLYNSTKDDLANHKYNEAVGTRYTYYPSNKLKSETDAEDNTTTYTYDVYGNKETETKPNGGVYIYGYDNLNRISKISFKDNINATAVLLEEDTYTLLNDGTTQKVQKKYLNDKDVAITTSIYNYKDKLVKQVNPDNTSISYKYNSNDTLDSETDENGNTTYYKYDGLNRLVEKWVPFEVVNDQVKYTYYKTDYDKADRKKTEYVGKTTVAKDGIPTEFKMVNYSYYKNDKVKSIIDNENRRTDYAYDADGNVCKEEKYFSTEGKYVVEYTNNYFGKQDSKKVHVSSGDIFGNNLGGSDDTILTTSFTYDANGNLKTEKSPTNVVITYGYDKLNRQVSTSQTGLDEKDTKVTITTSKKYSWSGKELTITDAKNNTTTKAYNQRDLLSSEKNARGDITTFYYDTGERLIGKVLPKSYIKDAPLTSMDRTEYSYDVMGRLKTERQIYKDPTTLQNISVVVNAKKYDKKGNVIKELDALGYEAGVGDSEDLKIDSGYGIQYTYNLNDDIVTALDCVGAERKLPFSKKYEYDALGRKLTETDAKGQITSYVYNNNDKIISKSIKKSASSNEVILQANTYDYLDNLISQKDANGNITSYVYNALGKVKQIKYAGDATIPVNTVVYQYDANGNTKFKQDSTGNTHNYTYNDQNMLITDIESKADGTAAISSTSKYDVNGNKRFDINGNNVKTEMVYDELNRPKQKIINVKDSKGNLIPHIDTTNYDPNGNVISEIDWRGNTKTSIYDPINRLIEKQDQFGKSVEKLQYYKNGAQYKSIDALNNETVYEYDKNKRLIKTTDPLNHVTSQSYDDNGNISTKTDGESHVTSYSYDELNRLTSVINANNETTSYTYDYNNNKLSQTDGKGNSIIFEYNAANKVVRKIDQGGRSGSAGNYSYDQSKVEAYTYNVRGQVATKVDRNGKTTNFVYDVHGNILSQTCGITSVSFTYDNCNNQLTMTDETGITTRTYDELNRVITKNVPGIGSTSYIYDKVDNEENSSIITNGGYAEVTTDPKGNKTTKIFDKGLRLKSVLADGKTTTYNYYDNGSKQNVVYPDGSSEAYKYFKDNTLNTLTNTTGSNVETYTYTYDKAGNQLTKADNKGTTVYKYDKLNRIQSVTEPNGNITSYLYDAAGNRETETLSSNGTITTTSYVYNEQNRLKSRTSKINQVTTEARSFVYDNNGNEITETKLTYQNGVQVKSEKTSNTYDEFNRLRQTTTPDGKILKNSYNGDGLRVSKDVNGVKTNYLYEGDKVILELDSQNNIKAKNIQGSSLVSRVSYSKDQSGNTQSSSAYYMYNGHGDVTKLIGTNGAVLASYYYDAFGNITENSGVFDNPYRYAGYQYDAETGTYYLLARMYDPEIARFMQEDTYMGDPNDPLSLNLYTYCHNNPIIYDDPNGHWIHIAIGAAIGGIINTAITAYEDYKDDGQFNGGVKKYLGAFAEGAITGAIGAATGGASLLTMVAADSVVSFAGNVINQAISKGINNISWKEAAYSGLGGMLGTVGGHYGGRVLGKAFGAVMDSKIGAFPVAKLSNIKTSINNLGSFVENSAYNIATRKSPGYIKLGLLVPGKDKIATTSLEESITKNLSKMKMGGNPDYSSIRAYTGIDVASIPIEYRADPRLVAEMEFKGAGKNGANAAGWERNAKAHFSELLGKNPEYWSERNTQLIKKGLAPEVDEQFAEHFPQYSDYLEDKLIHHHIGGGGQAAAVPESLHPGFGGIHNVEKNVGVRGNDPLSIIGQVFTGTVKRK